jgi:hypothetical protein
MTDKMVSSTSDERTVNNVMRHGYRVLSDEEKALMQEIKDDGLALWNKIHAIGSSRELAIAKTKLEEVVMWTVKHITGGEPQSKTTRVASEKEVGIDEPLETGGHDIDRDGPIPFDG